MCGCPRSRDCGIDSLRGETDLKPIHKNYNAERKTTLLFFDDHDPMECSMKGGVCWPVPFERNGVMDTVGYAVMAGMDLASGVVYVFEQVPWVVIDDIIGAGGIVKYEGLSHWLNRIWTDYFASVFYFLQTDEVSRRFRLQVIRSNMIRPKPRFVELPPVDVSDLIGVVWRLIKEGRLRFDKGSEIDRDLTSVKEGDKQLFPAVHALGCCLTGFDRFPWRKPYEQSIREILIPA